jgi:APA family basic amino acid/polyamine antiporter
MAETGGGFRRELGLLDAAVVVAGAIIGVGIFANPASVARILGDPGQVLLAWALGGALALLGGLAYAELGSRLPEVGGQYVYLRAAYPPVVGFLYGVALLCIINGGGLAAVAILLASYVDRAFLPLGARGVPLAAALGVRAGKWTNNLLMAAKLLGMAALMLVALSAPPAGRYRLESLAAAPPLGLLTALVPVMFAYGGWQNCGSIAGEIRDPVRNLARANVIGVAVVVVLYLGLNVAYLNALPVERVAASSALAADAAAAVLGEAGARLVSALIVVSALGFLSVIVMTGPRLYYAMAASGGFWRRAATLHPRHGTPVVTLWLQCGVAVLLIATNTYDQLLSYVVFADWLFFALAVGALFRLRRREPEPAGVFLMPGYPYTTALFVAVAVGIVAVSYFAYPRQSLTGTAILLAAAGTHAVFFRERGA